MRVLHNGETVADIPVSLLTDEAPLYQRPMAAPGPKSKVQGPRSASETTKTQDQSTKTKNHNSDLLKLLASPNLSSKQWVFRQYDHMVRTNTVVLPGADAAVVRIKETRRALAMSLDGNGRYCAANPREGAKLIVAEAARNVVCVGARPIAITNCLNFASPERPEVMWSFSEVIDGMAEACTVFNTPVISGNVSFYNETEGRGILPTPVIGMVGLMEDVRRVLQPGFKRAGDLVGLLGRTSDELGVSEYAATVEGRSVAELIATGEVPRIDLKLERAIQDT
jgi:phosphoribosylformylglycinamidine synthase